MKIRSILFVLTLFFTGCVSVGTSFDTTHIPDVEKGKTGQKEVKAWFGNPERLGVDDGEITWSYTYVKTGVLSGTIAKDLTLTFDKNGYVTSYSFTTTEEELDLKKESGQ